MSETSENARSLTLGLLAGGASSRLGGPRKKPLVDWSGGRPLLAVIADRLAPLRCAETLIAAAGDPAVEAAVPGARPVADGVAGAGPLAGIEALLGAARTPWVVVVATDLPFITAELCAGLAARARTDGAAAVVPVLDGRYQPLAAVYHAPRVLPIASDLLDDGRRAVHALLDVLVADAALGVDRVDGEQLARLDPDGAALLDVDTPEDLLRARARLGGR